VIYVGGAAPMRLMGAYANGTTYYPGDVVTYYGSTYVATVTSGNVPTNASYWQPLALAATGFVAGQKWGSD
jgi:hypothetical protein